MRKTGLALAAIAAVLTLGISAASGAAINQRSRIDNPTTGNIGAAGPAFHRGHFRRHHHHMRSAHLHRHHHWR